MFYSSNGPVDINNSNNNSEREEKHTCARVCVGGVYVSVGWVKGEERESKTKNLKSERV